MTSKFTPERRVMIIDWLERGHFRLTTAGRAGIAYKTLVRWINVGEAEAEICEREGTPPTEHAAFYLAVTKAEADGEDIHFTKVEASKHPEDARWILQRRWPQKWGSQPTRIEHSGIDGGPIQVNVADARKSFAKKLTAALGREEPAPADPGGEPGAGSEGSP